MLRFPLPSSLMPTSMRQDVSNLRDRLTATSQEAVTGRYSDLTAHLSGRIGTAMLGQKAIDDISQEQSRLTLREGRLDFTQRTLTVLQDSTNGLGARMQAALGSGDEAGQTSAASDAKSALSQSFTALNVRYGERYLFSGDATATPPFGSPEDLLSDIRQLASTAADAADFEAQLDTYFNTPGAGFQQTAYAGSPDSSDPDAVTGNDPAIIQVFRGLAVMALSSPDEAIPLLSGSSESASAAATTLMSGQTSLTALRADRGVIQAQISTRKDTLQIEATVLSQAFNDMTARDQYEAAADLQELENNLEASYLLTSRLSSLNLLNFLR